MRIEEVDAEEGEEEDRTQWGVQWTLVGSSKPTYGNLLPPWPAPGAGFPSKFHFGQAPPVINQPCVIAHTLVAPVGVAHIWDLWRRNIDLAWEQKDEIWFGLVPNIATRRLVFCFQKLFSAEKNSIYKSIIWTFHGFGWVACLQ